MCFSRLVPSWRISTRRRLLRTAHSLHTQHRCWRLLCAYSLHCPHFPPWQVSADAQACETPKTIKALLVESECQIKCGQCVSNKQAPILPIAIADITIPPDCDYEDTTWEQMALCNGCLGEERGLQPALEPGGRNVDLGFALSRYCMLSRSGYGKEHKDVWKWQHVMRRAGLTEASTTADWQRAWAEHQEEGKRIQMFLGRVAIYHKILTYSLQLLRAECERASGNAWKA